MASSIIGSSMAIDGDITGDEDLVIQGTVGSTELLMLALVSYKQQDHLKVQYIAHSACIHSAYTLHTLC